MATLLQRLRIDGKRFILIPETEYERLLHEAREAVPEDDLPALPKPDKDGNYPALEYARISLARDLIRRRKGLGLTQSELARTAGIRQETLSRIETGKHTPTVRIVEKIMHAIKRREQKRRRTKGR